MDRLWIPGPLPGLNEILSAKANRYKRGFSEYTALKRRWTGIIQLYASSQNFPSRDCGHFTYIFRERDQRRDPSNFMAGGHKLIEDALQGLRLLPNDGWKQVLSIQDEWLVDKASPGVTLFVTNSKIYMPLAGWLERDQEMKDAEAERTKRV